MYARKQTNWAGIVLGFLVVLLLSGVSAFAVWEYMQIKDLKTQVDAAKAETGTAKSNAFELRKNLQEAKVQMILAQQEDLAQTQGRVLKDISEQRELPKGETPTIAQVTDITKLEGEAFFAKAENGDYIIAYKKANVSILYRPLKKEIINTGTVNVQN